jgi:hypothetical protein
MHPSPENVHHLAEQVQLIWRKSRPQLMRLYDQTEQSETRALQAARRCLATTQDLQCTGLPFDQARNLAMHEWVYLPDIDASDELEIGRLGAHSAS